MGQDKQKPDQKSIERVKFNGSWVEAIQHEGRVWAVVKRICQNLGIDHDTQRVKLSSLEWAVTGMIPATGPDGKSYDMFCIDMDSLPMWLANIHAPPAGPSEPDPCERPGQC